MVDEHDFVREVKVLLDKLPVNMHDLAISHFINIVNPDLVWDGNQKHPAYKEGWNDAVDEMRDAMPMQR